jgi:hypothetical protein
MPPFTDTVPALIRSATARARPASGLTTPPDSP